MKNKAAQIYGYVVCVIAIITFLVSGGALISALIDMGEPLYSGYQDRTFLSSFENFKVESMKSIDEDAAYIPSDDELRVMYEAAKEEILAKATHNIRKNIIVNTIVLVVAVILFFIHWKWMVVINRKQPGTES